MEERNRGLDVGATRAASELLAELRERYGVSYPLREPLVYSLNSSRLKELAAFLARDFLGWPLALRERPPPAAVHVRSLVQGGPSIILTYAPWDRDTLRHEVRHHFSYECRRLPYLLGGAAAAFLREYYWEDVHSGIARERLRTLQRAGIPEEMNRVDYREALHVLESLSRGEFPGSWFLPDAVADIITEANPWISEGFAAEGSIADMARVPLKLLLAASTAGIVYGAVRLLSSAAPGPFLSLAVGYVCGGFINTCWGFLRSLPLDMGVLRWTRMRTSIRGVDVPKVLAFPPTKRKSLAEVLDKIEEYDVFQA